MGPTAKDSAIDTTTNTAIDTNTAADTWLRRFRLGGAARAGEGAARLVCFPHAGGSANFFLPLCRLLGPRWDVLCVQYPGRQDRRAEPPVTGIAALADQIAEALAAVPGPLAFFGHSMGAIVAFEVARRAEAAGTGPIMLVASGRAAPSINVDRGIHRMDDDGLIARIRELGGTAAGVLADRELLLSALPAIRHDHQAIETYVCPQETSIGCPITVLAGDRDADVPLPAVLAWAAHTTGEFGYHLLPGGHFYLVDRWGEVADHVVDYVANAVG